MSELHRRLLRKGYNATYRTVWNWVKGETRPDADALPHIANILGVRILDLYEGKRKKK